jgi:hypothetical protein
MSIWQIAAIAGGVVAIVGVGALYIAVLNALDQMRSE